MNIGYCCQCGQPTTRLVPPGDNLLRDVCSVCDRVHYVNPKVVAGCLLTCGEQILLARRAIEPRRDYWTLPAGFMELGETMLEAACRESHEEALARPRDPQLYGLISLPRIGQVYVIYRAEVEADGFGIGAESTDVRLFDVDEVPWQTLAFPTIELTLRRFLADRAGGAFPVFDVELRVRPGEPLPKNVLED